MPLFIDNSTLVAVATCDTKALLAGVHRLTSAEERIKAKCGSAFHEGLAAWFKGADVSTCVSIFAESYGPAVAEAGYLDAAYELDNVCTVLHTWLVRHPRESFIVDIPPEFVEVAFTVPIDEHGDYMLTGRMDALGRYREDNAYLVVDHKSTGRLGAWWAKQFRLSSQLSGYVYAAQEHFNAAGLHEPIVGAFINGIEISKVPTSQMKCKKHALAYAECGPEHLVSQPLVVMRTEGQLQQWRKDALYLAKKYQLLQEEYPTLQQLHMAPMNGTFTYSCTVCDFADFCGAERALGLVPTLLAPNTWRPFRPQGNAQ